MDSLLILIKLKMKKTEFTLINNFDVKYPAGTYMLEAIGFAKQAYDSFKEFYKAEDYESIIIWCRGSSGAILGALFAQQLINDDVDTVIRVNHIKKEGESAHSSPEWYCETYFNIVIDDLIASGDTMCKILNYIEDDQYHPRAKKEFKLDLLIMGGKVPAYLTRVWRSFHHVICEDFALSCNETTSKRKESKCIQ